MNDVLGKGSRDFVAYGLVKVIQGLTAFITIPLFSSLLSPAEYGVYTLATTVAGIGSIIMANWLTSSLMRFYPEYESTRSWPRLYSTSLAALAAATALFLVLLPGVWYLTMQHNGPVERPLLLAAVLFVLAAATAVQAVFTTVSRIQQRGKEVSLYTLLAGYVGLGLGIALVWWLGMGALGLVLGSALATMLSAALFVVSNPSLRQVRWRERDIRLLRQLLRYGVPATVSTLGTWALAFADRFVLVGLRGASEVGIYSIGYNLGERSVRMLIDAFLMAGSPVLMLSMTHGRNAVQLQLARITRFYLLLTLPAVGGIIALARPIFAVLVHSNFAPGVDVIPYVASGLFLYGLTTLGYTGLAYAKKTGQLAVIYILAALLNLALNLWLVPRSGFMGAALATTVAYAALLVGCALAAARHLTWRFPWVTLLRSGLATILMALSVYWLGNRFSGAWALVLGFPAGVVIYSVLVLTVGELRWGEIRSLVRPASANGEKG